MAEICPKTLMWRLSSSTADKTTVLGVCRFVPDDSARGGEFPGYQMSVPGYLIGAVPQKFQGNFRQTTWGAGWEYNTKIQVLEEPQHGELEPLAPDHIDDLVYYPAKGYIGIF